MSAITMQDGIVVTLGAAPAVDPFALNVTIDGMDGTATVGASGPGVFRTGRRSGDAPFAAIGAFARTGDIVGFLRRGPLLLPVRMPADGWILAFAPDGAGVGHGAPLVRILVATTGIEP